MSTVSKYDYNNIIINIIDVYIIFYLIKIYAYFCLAADVPWKIKWKLCHKVWVKVKITIIIRMFLTILLL